MSTYFQIRKKSGHEVEEDDVTCTIFFHQDGSTEIDIELESEGKPQ